MPATLLRILLQRAGIESNPGPIPKAVKCCNCMKKLNKKGSVRCSSCRYYAHFPCTPFTETNDVQFDWTCIGCTPPPVPAPAATSASPAPAKVTAKAPAPARKAGKRYKPEPLKKREISEKLKELNIMQFNCNGISEKATEIAAYLIARDIKIAAIQETKLGPKSREPNFGTQYTVLRQDRSKGRPGGGLLLIIHESILYKPLKLPTNCNDDTTESMAIKVKFDNLDVRIVNLYIPPDSSCPEQYEAPLQTLLQLKNAIILGDANAHDPLWHSSILNTRGGTLAGEIDNSDFGVLNGNSPTRLPRNAQATSPDISLASSSLLTSAEWSTEIELSSDHLPINIRLMTSVTVQKSRKKTYTNLKKSDWTSFQEAVEEAICSTPTCQFPTGSHLAGCAGNPSGSLARAAAATSNVSIPYGVPPRGCAGNPSGSLARAAAIGSRGGGRSQGEKDPHPPAP